MRYELQLEVGSWKLRMKLSAMLLLGSSWLQRWSISPKRQLSISSLAWAEHCYEV